MLLPGPIDSLNRTISINKIELITNYLPKQRTQGPDGIIGEEQTPEGDLHAEAGLNPKLNTRSCANKEEKGKFPHVASETAD